MIRFVLICLVSTIFLFSCDVRRKDKVADDGLQRTEQALKDSTTVELIDKAYNFGTISEGEKVEYNFRFKNTGKKPLIITNASASCGCTVPEKPEEPVKPGETGFIKVMFNTQGRVGPAHKTVTITSNANPAFPLLELKGDVTEAKK